MANATKHELYETELSFSIEYTDTLTGKKRVEKQYGGTLLIMTKNDDVRHISDMVTTEFLNKSHPHYQPNTSTKIQKVHITKLKRMRYQPSLGVIVEE